MMVPAAAAQLGSLRSSVYVLGQFALISETRSPAPEMERQEQALLMFLLLSFPGPVRRERIIETFWPERAQNQGAHCLSTTLWRLRRSLAAHSGIRIDSSRAGWLRLQIEETVTVDLTRFRDWAARGLQAAFETPDVPLQDAARAMLEGATDLYKDRLCPHLDYPWLDQERLLLEEQFVTCLGVLADHYERCGDSNRALATYRRILKVNPAREDAHVRIIMIAWKLGWRDRAMQQYEACAAALRAELDIHPTLETQKLVLAILRGETPSEPPARLRAEALDRSGLCQRISAIQTRVEHAYQELAELLALVTADGEAVRRPVSPP